MELNYSEEAYPYGKIYLVSQTLRCSPSQPIDVGNSDAFEECNDEEWEVATEVVEENKHIAASAMSESHRNQAAH
jgi:hypothetical protein